MFTITDTWYGLISSSAARNNVKTTIDNTHWRVICLFVDCWLLNVDCWLLNDT